MLTTRTPEAHAAVLERFRKLEVRHSSRRPRSRARSSFPASTAARNGAARRSIRRPALLYVNSNEMPWIVKLIPNNDTSLYN